MRRGLILGMLLAVFAGCDESERPDVVVDQTADGTTVTLAVDRTLHVRLRSAGDGGYSAWALDPLPEAAVLELTGAWHEDPSMPLPGDFGTDVFAFRAIGPGATVITASATQPWAGGDTATFTLDVTVE